MEESKISVSVPEKFAKFVNINTSGARITTPKGRTEYKSEKAFNEAMESLIKSAPTSSDSKSSPIIKSLTKIDIALIRQAKELLNEAYPSNDLKDNAEREYREKQLAMIEKLESKGCPLFPHEKEKLRKLKAELEDYLKVQQSDERELETEPRFEHEPTMASQPGSFSSQKGINNKGIHFTSEGGRTNLVVFDNVTMEKGAKFTPPTVEIIRNSFVFPSSTSPSPSGLMKKFGQFSSTAKSDPQSNIQSQAQSEIKFNQI